jgi:hypothetical protein
VVAQLAASQEGLDEDKTPNLLPWNQIPVNINNHFGIMVEISPVFTSLCEEVVCHSPVGPSDSSSEGVTWQRNFHGV